MDEHPYYRKIGADGSVLPREATEWEAVLDNRTNFTWDKNVMAVKGHKDAQKKAQTCTAAGFSNWQAPSVEQQFCIMDRTRVNPAIDPEFFPDCPIGWFHTSTVDVESPRDYAWLVFSDDGYSGSLHQDSKGFVRAVRVGQ